VSRLTSLTTGQAIVYGGDQVASVSAQLASAFREGDRLVVVHDTGELLHVPADEHARVSAAVDGALAAFHRLAMCDDDQITHFFGSLAARIQDDAAFAPVLAANAADVEAAAHRGRSTTRLVLSPAMREAMVDGLRTWQLSDIRRTAPVASIDHGSWQVDTWRAPLGVVGFVFEGRPNVFADATGVLRTGNTAVFRIGSDALGTARALMSCCLAPALADAEGGRCSVTGGWR
jgi:glutamate-5-semialdehyde dehydrogenase